MPRVASTSRMSIRRISEGGSSWHLNPGDSIGLPLDGGVDDPRMESTACARSSYFDHPCDVRPGSACDRRSAARYDFIPNGPPAVRTTTMALRSPPQHISTGLSSRWAIVRLERRNLVWINVTPHPTAEWNACQKKPAPAAADNASASEASSTAVTASRAGSARRPRDDRIADLPEPAAASPGTSRTLGSSLYASPAGAVFYQSNNQPCGDA